MFSKLNFLTASYLYEIIKSNITNKNNTEDYSEYIEDNSEEIAGKHLKEYIKNMLRARKLNEQDKQDTEQNTQQQSEANLKNNLKPNITPIVNKPESDIQSNIKPNIKPNIPPRTLRSRDLKSKKLDKEAEFLKPKKPPIHKYNQEEFEEFTEEIPDFYEDEVEVIPSTVSNILEALNRTNYDNRVSIKDIKETNIYKFPLIKFNNELSTFSIYINNKTLVNNKPEKNILSFKFKIIEINNNLLKINLVNSDKTEDTQIYYYPNYNLLTEIDNNKIYETFIFIKHDELKVLSQEDKEFILKYVNTYLKYEYALSRKELEKLSFFKTVFNPYIYLL